MTLRWRLTLAFALVVLVPLLVGAFLVARAYPAAVESRQQGTVSAGARLVGQVVADYCQRARTVAEAAGLAAGRGTVAEASAAARSLVQGGLADGVRVTGPSGVVVVAVGSVPATGQGCATGDSTDQHLAASVPLATAVGVDAGVALASFDVTADLLRQLKVVLGDADVMLMATSGQVVARTGSLPGATIEEAFRHPEGTSTGGTAAAGIRAGPDRPFDLVVFQPAAAGPGLLFGGSVIVILALIVSTAVALVTARATTRPLQQLSDAAARVASGDLTTSIEVGARDEVGRLAMAFNAMTSDLRTYVGQLRASRDELQGGLDRLGEGLASSHDLDRILHVVLESATASTRAASGMVLLRSPDGTYLHLAASQGLDVPLDLRMAMGEGITGQVAVSGEPLRGRVGHGPGELWPTHGEPTGTTCIAVPLKSSGRVIGVLDLFGSRLPGGFDDDDLATMRAFAIQATVAVDNVLLHEEAQRLAVTDGLTGLWNYRYFTMTLTKELERASRFGRPMALLMLDLDHFKNVNDSFGHPRGDEVLVELAARIRGVARDVDTVARYGGEELVVILPETDEKGARRAAERMCSAVRRKAFGGPSQPPITLTISAGVAVYPEHGVNPSQLLGRADEALYAAKHAGRDTWRVSKGQPDG